MDVIELERHQGEEALTDYLSRSRGAIYLSGEGVTRCATAIPPEVQYLIPPPYRAAQQKRDKGAYHITVLSKDEVKACKEIQEKSMPLRQGLKEHIHLLRNDWVDLGVGSAVGADKSKCFFKVIEWESAQQLREALGLPRKDFHITIGFKPHDVHGVVKDRSTLIGFETEQAAPEMEANGAGDGDGGTADIDDDTIKSVKSHVATCKTREELAAAMHRVLEILSRPSCTASRRAALHCLASYIHLKEGCTDGAQAEASRAIDAAPRELEGYVRQAAICASEKNFLNAAMWLCKGANHVQRDAQGELCGDGRKAFAKTVEKVIQRLANDTACLRAVSSGRCSTSECSGTGEDELGINWVVPERVALMLSPTQPTQIRMLWEQEHVGLLVTAMEHPLKVALFRPANVGKGADGEPLIRNKYIAMESFRAPTSLRSMQHCVQQVIGTLRRDRRVALSDRTGSEGSALVLACVLVEYGAEVLRAPQRCDGCAVQLSPAMAIAMVQATVPGSFACEEHATYVRRYGSFVSRIARRERDRAGYGDS